jgi:hypothetical protein
MLGFLSLLFCFLELFSKLWSLILTIAAKPVTLRDALKAYTPESKLISLIEVVSFSVKKHLTESGPRDYTLCHLWSDHHKEECLSRQGFSCTRSRCFAGSFELEGMLLRLKMRRISHGSVVDSSILDCLNLLLAEGQVGYEGCSLEDPIDSHLRKFQSASCSVGEINETYINLPVFVLCQNKSPAEDSTTSHAQTFFPACFPGVLGCSIPFDIVREYQLCGNKVSIYM